MNKNTNETIISVGIAGLGGVGGFLAAQFLASPLRKQCQLSLWLRPQKKEIFAKEGLVWESPQQKVLGFADVLASKAEELPALDLLFICTKSYSLGALAESIQPAIASHTRIIPLQNGILALEQLQQHFPENIVVPACIYVVAKQQKDNHFICQNKGGTLHLGSQALGEHYGQWLSEALALPSCKLVLSAEIEKARWEKFVFISALASISCATRLCLGELLENPRHVQNLRALMQECIELGIAKGIALEMSLVEQNLEKMRALPYATKPSMLEDLLAGGQIEKDALSEYVLINRRLLGLESPAFAECLKAF